MKDSNQQINSPSDRVDVFKNKGEAETTKSPCLSKKALIIIIAVAAVLVILLIVLLCVFLIKDKSKKKEKILIDVDEGQDDMTLLILAALSSKDFEILGVTTESPVQYVDTTTLWHQKFRDYLGFDYPIYKGFNKPLERPLPADVFHHKYGYEYPEPYTPPIEGDAIDFIVKTLKENKKISIINAAPSSNIPYVIKNHPELKSKIERIVMMGGTIYGNGNIDECLNKCEYNIWADPEGAKILLDSGLPIVMVSADLTNIDVYDDNIIAKIKKLGNKFSEMVLKLWEGSRATWNNLTAHDPHIILYMLDKKLFKTKKTKIDVLITPGDNTNYGVLKEVPCKGKECNVIYVEGFNTEEDRDKYWEEFIDILAFKKLEKKFKIRNNPEKESEKEPTKDPEKEPEDPLASRKKLQGVEYHTIEEVKDRIKANTPTSSDVTYSTPPSAVSPFVIGRLSDTTLNNALLIFNNFRYIAGISPTVTVTDNYNELAQAGSLLMAANKKMSHSDQPQPSGMDNTTYNLGVEGCSSSNIYSGLDNLNNGIFGWVEDSGNFNTMGHRRWILNPSMKSTGFGFVNSYSAMYAFDNSFGSTEFYGVAWPAQNTPLSYFGNNYAWTYSKGEKINTNDITVTLKNLKDGKVYTFDKSDASTFLLNNSNYGKPGCIAFLPSLSYSDGDTFEVGIHGTEVNVDYTVYFFDL